MTVKEMRERRGQIAAEMSELAKNLTSENMPKFDALDAEQKGLKEQIERAERASQLDAELRTSRKPGEPPIGDPQNDPEERNKRYHRAWNSYLKNGLHPDQYGFRGVNEEDRAILLPFKQTIQLERRDMRRGFRPAVPIRARRPASSCQSVS